MYIQHVKKKYVYDIHGCVVRLRLSTGYVHADGGDGLGVGGGGGGGRIALHCKTGHIGGDIKTYGGRGLEIGAAGTIYVLYQSSSKVIEIILVVISTVRCMSKMWGKGL